MPGFASQQVLDCFLESNILTNNALQACSGVYRSPNAPPGGAARRQDGLPIEHHIRCAARSQVQHTRVDSSFCEDNLAVVRSLPVTPWSRAFASFEAVRQDLNTPGKERGP